MDEQVQRLVDKTWEKYEALPASQRLLIAIGGIPGSGKTTLAQTLVSSLNARYTTTHPSTAAGTSAPIASLVPMDGFHLTRAQLATMPDPAHAAARRGAAFTFDAPAYLALVRALREPVTPESTTVRAPSFDHAVKDPVEDDIAVGAGVRVVVFEGLYVAMGGEEWGEAAGLMDETWFVEVEEARAKERLVRRHVASGIEKDREAAARRAEENDLVNGREILERLVPHVTERIQSKEDDAWKPGAPDDAPGKDVQV